MKSRSGQVLLQRLAVFAVAAMLIGAATFLFGQAKPKGSTAKGTAAPKASSADTNNKVVIRVGKEEVTKADMDQLIAGLSPQAQQNIASGGKRNLGEQYAEMMVLDQQAEKDHLASDPQLRQRLELQRRQLLAQVEYQKLAEQVQVTPAEVSQYFDAHKDSFDTVDIYEVLIRKKSPNAKAGDSGLALAEAQSKVNAIRAALTSGSNIEAVSKEFTIPNVVVVDTTPRTIHHGQLTPALDKEIFSLNKGQVTKPYDTPQAIGLFQVADHQPADLKSATNQIESDLREEKLDAEIAALRKSANVWLDQDYFKPEPAAGNGEGADSTPKAGGPKKR